MTPEESSPPLSIVLERIYHLLTEFGRWPTWDELDDELDRRAGFDDPWQAVKLIDRNLLWSVGDGEPSDNQVVGLTVAGLREVPAAADDLEILAATVLSAVSAARAAPVGTGVSITGDLVDTGTVAAGDERDAVLRRQSALWDVVHGLWTTRKSGVGAGNWTIELGRKQLRPLRKATTIDEMIDHLSRPPGAPSHPVGSHTSELEPELPSHARTDSGVEGASAWSRGVSTANDGAGDPRSSLSLRDSSTTAHEATSAAAADAAFTVVTAEDGTAYSVDFSTELGRGTYGNVHPAQGPDGELVAAKVVHVRAEAGTEAWYRDSRLAMREAVAGAYLDAKDVQGVVPLLGHVLTERALTLFFARADHSLESVVAARRLRMVDASGASEGVIPLGEAEVREIGIELAVALHQLHERGVMHRDIKPGNALLWNDRWCWSDLGIARVLEQQTETFTFALGGTRAYTAPEVLARTDQTVRSDVYSLGCTLYELATGTVPFPDDPTRGHLTGNVDFDVVADPILRRALTYALAKSAAARPSAGQLGAMLSKPATAMDRPGYASFRDLAARGRRREDERAALEGRAAQRAQASADAMVQFRRIWDDFIELAHEMDPDASGGHEDDSRSWMRLYDDQMYVVRSAPSDGATPATAVGLISMQPINKSSRAVAHVYAEMQSSGLGGDGEGLSRWRWVKLQPNFLRAGEMQKADRRRVVALDELERWLVRRDDAGPPDLVVVSDDELTVDALIELFASEAHDAEST